MDNYFVSYSKRLKRYIIPKVSVLSNNTQRPSITEMSDNPILMKAFRVTKKFNPYTVRLSHPIDLCAFVLGPDGLYYEVIEGLYMVEDGTLKLKVKKKYG